MTLESVSRDCCIVSAFSQIDPDTTDLTMQLKKDNGNWLKIAENKMEFINKGKITFFKLTDMKLKTGFEYRILLEIGHDNDKLQSNSFTVKGL